MTVFAELAAATNFSFLRGASHPRHMVLAALLLGHAGIGIADRNTVAGTARAHAALRDLKEGGEQVFAEDEEASHLDREELRRLAGKFHLALGARLVFADATPDILAHAANRAGWARLCRLLTEGNRRAPKGQCILRLEDLLEDTTGLLLTVMPERRLEALPRVLRRLREAAPDAVWLGATMPRRGDDRRRLLRLRALAEAARVPLLATNDALYAVPAERDLQDVLTCIREGVPIEAAGRLLQANAERHLKPPAEMERLFRDAPEALVEAGRLLGRAGFSLGDLRYEYPDEPVPPGWTASAWLRAETWRCAEAHYSGGVPDKVKALLEKELRLIERLGYEPYFLTILDIVRFAQERGILCQGRGSAANSAVCFVLGITSVDPAEHEVLFARFLSEERREPPDIDVDFEHERREEVIQYIYRRYGRHRAGIVATISHYRPRGAMREVGKALGLTEDVTARLASTQWGSWGREIEDAHVREAGLDPENPVIRRALRLARRLLGYPRHLSQHVGGFVLARGRLDELVPVANAAMADRTFIEWDKDDIDALGLMKVDVLALGMLTCIRKAFELMTHHGLGDHGLATVPREDERVYEMLCKGDSIGVFQVESRAQINMLPRLKPREFYDLVIQVAIVRPGPIQGDMVHPYLRRRAGLEEVEYPSPAPEHGPPDELRQVLKRTLGVPLFQEQAMSLAMVAAHFTDGEVNRLRKAMATFRSEGMLDRFADLMVGRMVERGYEAAFARRCFEQIRGFGSYGFPESHAASFARLVYISSWIKCFQPAVFACALLNSQPMGFYAPAQIIRDAQEHGVPVRAVDVNHSGWDSALERQVDGNLALRLGFRQADGLPEAECQRLVAARAGGYADVESLATRAGLSGRTLRGLAEADAFGSIGLGRRDALWAIRRLPEGGELPLFAAAAAPELAPEPPASLPVMPLGEEVADDYRSLRLSLKGHPMGLLREVFQAEALLRASEVAACRDGGWVRTAGLVLVRQRPGNGNAIFITLEDETGIVNVVLWASTFERFRREVMAARLMGVDGRVQKSPEGVMHLLAHRIHDRSTVLRRLSDAHEVAPQPSRADEAHHGHPRDARLLPRSRDFH